jgi:hypothetical protein
MKSKPKNRVKDTPEAQHKRFIEAAKEAEADERPEAFNAVFKRIARSKRTPKPSPR